MTRPRALAQTGHQPDAEQSAHVQRTGQEAGR